MQTRTETAKFGQVILFGRDKERLVFIKKNQTRFICYNLGRDCFTNIRGTFEVTEETSQLGIDKWNEEQNRKMKNSFDGMKIGQGFMFKGDKYYLVKIKRTNAEMTDGKGGSWNLKLYADILATNDIKIFCKYCNDGIVEHEDLLCKECASVFGHARYSEL